MPTSPRSTRASFRSGQDREPAVIENRELLSDPRVEPIFALGRGLEVHGFRVRPLPTLEDHDNGITRRRDW